MMSQPAAAPLLRPAWGAATDRGTRRAINEDSFLAQSPVFMVADGMGGHEAGEVASALAVEALRCLVGRPSVTSDQVQQQLLAAQRQIGALESLPGRGAGTTVAGLVLAEQDAVPYWLVVNLGDSRTYRLAGGLLEQISVDHSEVQERIDGGSLTVSEAAHDPRRHIVTRALSAGISLEVDYWLIPMEAHDRMLVCSDGLTGELTDDAIAAILLTVGDPQLAAEQLVAAAVAAGGRDNVTVLVIDAGELVDDDGDDRTAPRAWVADDDGDTLPRVRCAQIVGS
ncbi:PP2C family protein-serine/threonine phosphatase [Pengzhenrongella phosphoraccumulans]|jgi:PPM family protein phosphatase|uniref:PP2C family protein-serine/threonine phosphatase n=1 Tax=Pengzhenrongella phosphoraccumulans TaxID=3114394 RepID=UPI00388F1D1E